MKIEKRIYYAAKLAAEEIVNSLNTISEQISNRKKDRKVCIDTYFNIGLKPSLIAEKYCEDFEITLEELNYYIPRLFDGDLTIEDLDAQYDTFQKELSRILEENGIRDISNFLEREKQNNNR